MLGQFYLHLNICNSLGGAEQSTFLIAFVSGHLLFLLKKCLLLNYSQRCFIPKGFLSVVFELWGS